MKGSDGVWRSGGWLEDVGGEVSTVVREFEKENDFGVGAASGQRWEIELRLNRGDE